MKNNPLFVILVGSMLLAYIAMGNENVVKVALEEAKFLYARLKEYPDDARYSVNVTHYPANERKPTEFMVSISPPHVRVQTLTLGEVYVISVRKKEEEIPGRKGGSWYFYCDAQNGKTLGYIGTK